MHMLTDAYLHRLDALRLRIAHPARGGAGGVRRSKALGSSAEFSDFREYAPGDDIRRVDWNAYARFDRLFLRLFTEEKESLVTVAVDGSASMAAKQENAVRAAEALAYLALTGGDRLRILWLREKNAVMSPYFAGRAAYPRASAFLAEQVMAGACDLAAALRSADPYPKGLTFLITDGYQEGGVGKTLDFLLYRRQEAALIQVLSAFEMEPDLEGALRLRDAEGAPDVDMLLDGAALRQYRDTLRSFLEETRAACRTRSMAWLLLDGRRDFEETFLADLSRNGIL